MSNKKELDTKTDTTPTSASSTGGLLSFEEFDHFFDDFLSRKWPRLIDWDFPSGIEKGFPKVDILDHDHEIEVHAALPGVNKEDVKVSITNQSINIHASTKESKEEKKEEGRYFRREIKRGEFQRTLSLPENVDGDKATASFKDGILKVTIPKIEKSKRNSIEVK
ncbi:MAG: Hsp20/alpha crystallin family protein [Methylovulum sp.]